MSELRDVLDQESRDSEANLDAPIPPGAKVTRGHGRSKTLQVRLNDDEYATLEDLAERRGLPLSTMVRALLLTAVDSGSESPAERIARLHRELDLLSQ
ncbi:MAG: ribbon-helix-helix protein, CopG family [Rhodococcus sp.]|nr:ribbon-helix-helix protein, CopG family [Rhodococcus sp. (in: high G+C Gram-positive bacteria)]